MPTIGLDCQLILDGVGYWIEPGSYLLQRPRQAAATGNRILAANHLGAGERYVDFGPQKRQWTFVVPCFQAMKDYSGHDIVMSPPSSAATVAAPSAGGTLAAGAYTYQVTFVNAQGETTAGPASAGQTVVAASGNYTLALSAIPIGPTGTTSRKVYRSLNAGAYGLVDTVADNTTTSWTDTGAAAGAAPPTVNGASRKGQDIHDDLVASYEKVNTVITFVDPVGTSWNVHFDELVEEISDMRAQPDSSWFQWFLTCTLREA